MEGRWEKIVALRACDIVSVENLSSGSQVFLNSKLSPEALIVSLSEAGKWPDAITVMASSLPRREAVWWACVCCRHVPGLDADKGEMNALEAAEKWVFKPSDKNRSESFFSAGRSSTASAGTLTALAAGCSDSKLKVDENHEIDIDSSSFAQIVAAAVLVAASMEADEKLNDVYSLFILMGEDIAKGGNGRVEKS